MATYKQGTTKTLKTSKGVWSFIENSEGVCSFIFDFSFQSSNHDSEIAEAIKSGTSAKVIESSVPITQEIAKLLRYVDAENDASVTITSKKL